MLLAGQASVTQYVVIRYHQVGPRSHQGAYQLIWFKAYSSV